MKITLQVLRQKSPNEKSYLETHTVEGIDPDMKFLYMLDMLNGRLAREGIRPIAFNHGCREGICGCCGFMINGVPHGLPGGKAVCQLSMLEFEDGDVLLLEPFRSRALPVIRDLLVAREALDRIIQAGAFVPSSKRETSDPAQSQSVDARPGPLPFCVECGACVAACPNGSAMLFAGAKYAVLSAFHPDRSLRVTRMVEHMDAEGFGACSNHRECEAACPKGISVDVIAALNSDYISGTLRGIGR